MLILTYELLNISILSAPLTYELYDNIQLVSVDLWSLIRYNKVVVSIFYFSSFISGDYIDLKWI